MVALALVDLLLAGLRWTLAIVSVCLAIHACRTWADSYLGNKAIPAFLFFAAAAATGYWAYLAHPAFDEVGRPSGASSTAFMAQPEATGPEDAVENEAFSASPAAQVELTVASTPPTDVPSDELLLRARECRQLLDEDIPAARRATLSAIRGTTKTLDAGRVPGLEASLEADLREFGQYLVLLDKIGARYEERAVQLEQLRRKLVVQGALGDLGNIEDEVLRAEFARVAEVRLDLESDLKALQLSAAVTEAEVRAALKRAASPAEGR
ncbi:hypothetical protein OAQ71_00060 [bacterium]|nr:hypothetical protein [bacterium]